MSELTDDYMLTAKMEKAFEWRKWLNKIPYLKFPPDWEVKAVPPFAGAIVRYHIRKGKSFVSVYLDCYDRLGYMGEPYWELHPFEEDTYRCLLNETDDLLDHIQLSLENQASSSQLAQSPPTPKD